MTLSCAISGVLGIRATEIAISGDFSKISDLFMKYGRMQFIVLGFPLLVFLTFGQLFINLWLGETFNEAYWMGCFILVPMTIDLVQNIIFSVMQVRNEYGFRAKLYVIMAIINVILSIPAAKLYGGVGCSFVTGFILLIGNGLCLNIYFFRRMKLDVIIFWKELFHMCMPLFLMMGVGIGIQEIFIIPTLVVFGIIIFCYAILYALLMWKFVLNVYEKNIFINMLNR